MNNDYPDYAADDLLQHPGFLSSMRTARPYETDFWLSWRERYPGREQELEMAAQLYRLMHMQEDVVPTAVDVEEVWQRIAAETVSRPVYRSRRMVALAASILLLIGIGGGVVYWWQLPSKVVAMTKAGAREIMLPDGTRLVLQPGSECRYYTDLARAGRREIWVKGGAWLDVSKREAPFVVHLDSMEVVVLGTRFNVMSRQRQQHVMLEQGRVKVTEAHREVLLEPGEIAYRSGTHLRKQTIDIQLYSGWRTGKLEFENTTMKDIIALLAYAYGYEVRCPNEPGLLSRKISGSIAADNESSLLYTLSVAFRINFIQQENIITIIPNRSN
ncbi:FecR domain-containing protein [Chitinophaga pendula]|uniref:FecR family protein n=1 Tax=Chitinophaga TaxID=79328 RepID=UPI000BAF9590|nr:MULTISPECIES: FecR domain-containing protein [Chitinophaga]ASZ12994.1 hypothetical protein CK934_19535 [Chitinophaga sp. MD30]UCJ09375.1 FecR domain-containing protein [Chitinophaga pendula]